jgi:hypothetical protein
MSGDGPNLAAQQQAMNHGKGGPNGATSLENFLGAKDLEAVKRVTGMFAASMKDISGGAHSDEGGGGGGGGTNVSYADLGANSGPIINTTASQQSMVDLVGGRNGRSGGDDSGGRGI